MPPGLYVHIPFCRAKCGYCDFASAPGTPAEIDAFLGALAAESARYDGLAGSFSTLYVGGGTPSLLSPEQLDRLFGIIETLTGPLAALRESTFEANPESLDSEKAALLKRAGVNRVSLGLQAPQDALLKRLGRVAMSGDFLKAWDALRAAGFDNLNADLMCGLPGQSQADFAEAIAWLLKLKLEHVSFYALEVHEGTPFAAAGVKEDPESAADMYAAGAAALEAAGLARYEISNFARPGRQSLHNLNYWEQGDYLGLGPAAASCLGGERRANTADTDDYVKAALAGAPVPQQYRETLAGRARRAERIMLGLRKTAGIELTDDIFIEFKDETERLLKAGLIERSGRTIRIKPDRLYVSNAVFREFV
ncbi:MAG: radical SAM family heme chaperone HemW [Elusimicrobiales bacterium]|nr:radical SAM family heme chaperone HemW [Elusimicrobiales bacterium]